MRRRGEEVALLRVAARVRDDQVLEVVVGVARPRDEVVHVRRLAGAAREALRAVEAPSLLELDDRPAHALERHARPKRKRSSWYSSRRFSVATLTAHWWWISGRRRWFRRTRVPPHAHGGVVVRPIGNGRIRMRDSSTVTTAPSASAPGAPAIAAANRSMTCSRVVEAEEDHARLPAARQCRDLAEVQVEGQDDAILRDGLGKDIFIGHPMEPFVAQVRHLVSLFAQAVDDSLIDAHVGEKSHAGSAKLHLLLREPSRVAERLLDVLALEIGVARENLVEGGAVRDLTDDDRDRNPHPADAGAAAHDGGIKCDAIEHRQLLSTYQRSACGRRAAARVL